ncbi:MAG: hypothetical protein LQ337_001493 [Flavoplaca oasis]|nr:MAG: hypothetical protein LQ337_001493 [Flavoplaca oasis]
MSIPCQYPNAFTRLAWISKYRRLDWITSNIQEGGTGYRRLAVAIAGDDGIRSAILKLIPTIDGPDTLDNATKCAPGVNDARKQIASVDATVEAFRSNRKGIHGRGILGSQDFEEGCFFCLIRFLRIGSADVSLSLLT